MAQQQCFAWRRPPNAQVRQLRRCLFPRFSVSSVQVANCVSRHEPRCSSNFLTHHCNCKQYVQPPDSPLPLRPALRNLKIQNIHRNSIRRQNPILVPQQTSLQQLLRHLPNALLFAKSSISKALQTSNVAYLPLLLPIYCCPAPASGPQ
jgi:hypothetical protein